MVNNKKGSEFVEASVVMPIVILAILAVLWIIINLYSATLTQATGHMLIRDYAGNDSGMQASVEIVPTHPAIYGRIFVEGVDGRGLAGEILKMGVYGKALYDFDKSYRIGANYDATANHSASVYLIKQAAGIRKLDLLK